MFNVSQVYSLGWKKTLVVVGQADIAWVALAEDVGVNTVEGITQTQLNTPPLEDTKAKIAYMRLRGVAVEMGANCYAHNTHKHWSIVY